MAVVYFEVEGDSVTGAGRVKAGVDHIEVNGVSPYRVYAYMGTENMCQSLIGKDHISTGTRHLVLETATHGDYQLATGDDVTCTPTNGKLHVGS
jgi:hypothetical protein